MKHFAFFFSLLLIIYGLGNFYVLYRGYQWAPFHGPCLKWIFIIWGIVMMLSLPLMNLFSLPWSGLQTIWMTVSYSWLVFVLYAFMLVLLADLTGGLLRLFHLRDVIPETGRSVLWFSALVFLLGLLLAGNYRYRHFVRKEVHFGFPGSVKIVAISDLHLGLMVNSAKLEQFVKTINKEKPDVVLIAGDLIDHSLKRVREQDMGSLLQRLEAPLGVY
ncbi:MAG: metallophosphoesterase, partial [Bacteroidales bacterium]|nr:metallophosphoesterase [Bacteroidales bacterium]